MTKGDIQLTIITIATTSCWVCSSLDPSPSTEKEGLVTTVCAWVDSIVNLLVKLFVFYRLVLWSPTWLISIKREKSPSQLQARTRITDLTEMASNKCLEASRLASRWESVSTDRKKLTTLPQYKTWLFNTRVSMSKSRREVESHHNKNYSLV